MIFALGAIGILIGLAILTVLVWIINLLFPILAMVVGGIVVGTAKLYAMIVLWMRELRNDRRGNA